MRHLSPTIRALLRAPGYAITVSLTVGLAIGLAVAVIGAVNAVLRPESPFREPERLFSVRGVSKYATQASRDDAHIAQSLARIPGVERVAGYRREAALVRGPWGVEQHHVEWVSADFFSIIGVAAREGIVFSATEASTSDVPAAVVSDEFFRRTLNGSLSRTGAEVVVNDRAFRVIGVAPPTLGRLLSADIWLLDATGTSSQAERGAYFAAVVRVRPDFGRSELEEGLRSVARRWQSASADLPARFLVDPLAPAIQEFSELHRALVWSVAAILMVACANLANLTLARAIARESTHAVARALGATRRRIAVDVMKECVILAGLGGVIGALAVAGLRGTIRRLIPVDVPYVGALDVRLDWSVYAMALLVTVGVAVLVSLAPAVRASRVEPEQALKEAKGGSSTSRRRLYAWIVVVQVAVALAMFTNATLLVGASARLRTFALGYARAGLLEATVTLPRTETADGQSHEPVFDAVLSSTIARSAVSDVSWFGPPPVAGLSIHGFSADGSQRTLFRPSILSAGPHFFRTLGARVLEGRDFLEGDREGELLAIVDDKVARALWPTESGIGKQIAVNGIGGHRRYARVVGVVASVRLSFSSFDVFEVSPGAVYLSAPSAATFRTLLIRTSNRELPRVLSEFAVDVTSAAPRGTRFSLSVADAAEQRLEEGHRFVTYLFAALAACSLLLTIVGLFSILEYATVTRRRDYAIRLALGATRQRVARMIAGEAVPIVLGGTALGGGVSLVVTLLIDPFLLDLYRVNVSALVFAEAAILLSAIFACAAPTLRASRTRPSEALRDT